MSEPILVEFQHSEGHLDLDVQPPYQMVPAMASPRLPGSAMVEVANDDDVFLKNEKENLSTVFIDDRFRSGDGRVYEIDAVSVGSTFIHAYDRKSGKQVPGWRLQVDVKGDEPITIAFHSVIEDLLGDKTKRDSGVHRGFVNLLNDIFKDQCNVSFDVDSTVMEDIKIDTTFDFVFRDEPTQGPFAHMHDHWNTIRAACDPNALFNIFFMPDPQVAKLFELGGGRGLATNILIFPDPMPDDKIMVALPHRIARAMNCPTVTKDQFKHYLMFHKRADGEGDVMPRGKVPFIGREVVRQLNPKGSYR